MRLTSTYLRKWFDYYNSKYFGYHLPDKVILRVSNSRTQLGRFSCCSRRKWTGRKIISNCKISISEYYVLPEEEVHNILLHEMIHYYIAFSGMRDTSSHGKIFSELMNRINSLHGHSITVSAKTNKWPIAEKNKQPDYLVLALTLKDGTYMLTVVNKKYLNTITERCKNLTEVTAFKWYISTDEYFAHFPTVRSLRGQKVSKELFEEKTKEMKEIEIP